ncbi:protein fem-1 homolog C-like [Pollicipes pollicipes]|uniref:protein fem-1 homolog C-like n=1 Tax=Pollicipes pollicipes TaxID=41117 RepID=UPI001885827A|nr:protein fem-1 homolog C-like [Pollicipes pollicipes]
MMSSLRPGAESEWAKSLDQSLFRELHTFVRMAAPGATMRASLAARLMRLTRRERRALVSQVLDDGCSPLFLAAKEGQLALVQYLLDMCDADIEQRGEYEVANDRTRHRVTPLWCAAVAGRLPVVRCLCQHGADVNCQSDSGSTPVRSACFMTHLDIVVYLVSEAGADIQRPNHSGGTCLINSVQSEPLCHFLIQHGACVNAVDIQHKSALHYAIQEHREETTRLLLHHGADPFIVSKAGDDALQTACLKGDPTIFALLQSKVSYDEERLADAYELIGATFVDELRDIPTALSYWRQALAIRHRHPRRPIVKRRLAPNKVYLYQQEFQTHEDLDDLRPDWDAVKIQSLIITERVLGVTHKDMTFRLMYRGAAYADSLLFQRCIDLWLYALQLRVRRDRVLFHESCFTAQALVRLLLDVLERRGAGLPLDALQYSDVADTLDVIASQLAEAVRLVRVRPVYQRQQKDFDVLLMTLARLVYLLLHVRTTAHQAQAWRRQLYGVLKLHPRTCADGNSLLHLAVSNASQPKSQFDEAQLDIFPSAEVAAVLLECGAPVDEPNDAGVTPLLMAARGPAYRPSVVSLLLAAGAHVDRRIGSGHRDAAHTLLDAAGHRYCRVQHAPLRCLAARVVSRHVPRAAVPYDLRSWVDQH